MGISIPLIDLPSSTNHTYSNKSKKCADAGLVKAIQSDWERVANNIPAIEPWEMLIWEEIRIPRFPIETAFSSILEVFLIDNGRSID